MQLKKLICIGLSLTMLASAAGCGAATGAATASEPAAETEAEPSASDSAGAETAGSETAGAETAGAEEKAQESTPAAEAGTESTDSTAAAAAGEEISPGDISVTWDDSHIYRELTLGRCDTITTYGVKEYEDVPFIRVSDYLNFLFGGKQKVSVENGVMKIDVNGAEAVIDPTADTITFENPARFRSYGDIDGAIVEKAEYGVITPSVKNASSQTETKPLTISLKDYNMPVIAYEDDILMPFLALQNTIGSTNMNCILAYNGKDYFNAFEAIYYAQDHEDAVDSPYMKAIYNGPFNGKTETTQAYADYGYYSTCLLLDMTFGHKEEKNITTFDEYFTRMNASNNMRSTNPEAAAIAETMLFFYLFDSGHDAMFSMDTVFGKIENVDKSQVSDIADEIKSSEEGKELFDEEKEKTEETQDTGESPLDVILGALLEKGLKAPEVVPLYAWTYYLKAAKPEDYGTQRLDYVDDTAVIYFEGFKDDTTSRIPSYYLEPVHEEDEANSNLAFFYDCFEDIKQHEEVKNVVINLSNNGGGAASGLITILGFLSPDGEVRITDRDIMAGNYREECYHIDTNLDGVADDQDGFGGQYDFYIMCSGSSYSCGNALPYFAKQEGYAKVIGTNPGGGDCVVGYFIDAYGRCAVYSGMLKLGKEDANGFVSDEKATTVDLNMMPSVFDIENVPWFDAEGITDAVHRYQNGETVITYGEGETSEEDMTGIVDLLLDMYKAFMGGEEGEAEAGSEAATETEPNN